MSRLLIALMTFVISAQNTSPDLATVIHRATSYVTGYEAALGNLIGTEDYVQHAHWSSGRDQSRQTFSDFLIVQVGSNWVGLRDVNTVDGTEVRHEQKSFESAFSDPSAGNSRLFNSMKAASARYNIGDVMREANLPTFALQVLRKDEAPRFSFERDGMDNLEGLDVWRVRFVEKKGKTLVRNSNGKDLHSTGMLWIDPNDGRVLKTEFDIENRLVKPPIKSSMVATYVQGKKIDLLVPGTMVEHYEAGDNVIDCRAEYTGFRSFHADVRLDFDSGRKPQ